MNEYIEVIARARRVLADQLGFVSLPDCGFQNLRFINILTANIDISGASTHCETCDQGAFDELVRIMAADLPILVGTRLRFIGVDDEEAWTTILAFLRHEGPFESGDRKRVVKGKSVSVRVDTG